MLEVRSIAKRYGDVLALTDLTVDVGERSCLVLLGRNGAGKTTALRCMAGVLAPSAGTVRVDGIDAASEPAAVRARVGLMPELPTSAPSTRWPRTCASAGSTSCSTSSS